MRSLPFGFHFVIKQLSYNVTSDFAVQNEGGSKQNSFSQWGLVDAFQELKIKNSHTIHFYSSELERYSFYKRTFCCFMKMVAI